MRMHALPLVLSVGLCLGVAASAQTQPKLTARELFYTPVSNVKQPEAKAPTAAKPVRTQQPSKPKTAERVPSAPAATEPEVIKQRRTESPRLEMAAAVPLALRYSLLKRNENDDYVEVDPETVFRSGDKIRVSLQSNDDAYLYIVQQGSSKSWNVLFPNNDTEHGNNHIERNRQYTIPPAGARFTFDDQPGTERLFIVVARQPLPDMETLIYSLSSGEKVSEQPKVLLAQSRPIDDGLVAKLRSQLVARDLVFEKVDETKPGPKKENAMYVATQDMTPNARIVVDLNLVHR